MSGDGVFMTSDLRPFSRLFYHVATGHGSIKMRVYETRANRLPARGR